VSDDTCEDCGRPFATNYAEWQEKTIKVCGESILEDASCFALANERLKSRIRDLEVELSHEKREVARLVREKQTVDNITRRHRDSNARLSCEKHTMQMALGATRIRLQSLSRIVRRALASGQLEKLEDAKRYLDEDSSHASEPERR
jgi:hypothetical protein